MEQQTSIYFGAKTDNPKLNLAWDKNLSARNLLDVVIHILANEYVRAVKENPVLFSEKGGSK